MATQGIRLKEIREKLKLNQSELAEKLNVKSQSIWKAEKDINKLSNDSLYNLLSQFNVNINYILAGIEPMFVDESLPDDFRSRVLEILISEGLKK